MLEKMKRPKALNRSRIRDCEDRLFSAFLLSIIILYISYSVATILLFFLNPNPATQGKAYRFCLSTASSDSCVMRPGIIIGDKISKSPDKLLDYFGSIPARVQQEWRVWVMDDLYSKTTELTVAEFYMWIDSVWKPLRGEERELSTAQSTLANG